MRINDIHIERYGAWHELRLELGPGLNVMLGPNGTGKSTLLRFVRTILYGSTPPLFGADGWAGSVGIEHRGRTGRLRRASSPAGAATLQGWDVPAGQAPHQVLMQGIDEQVFQYIFAVGIRELQEFGTLQDREIADHIFGLALGPEGRRLLEAGQWVQAERRKLIDPFQQAGTLVDLASEQDDLEAKFRQFGSAQKEYRDLTSSQRACAEELADIRKRQGGLSEQLRGHQFLAQVYEPWRRVQQLTAELAQMPQVAAFPADGLPRMTKLDHDLKEVTRHRDELVARGKGLRQKAAQLSISPDLREQSAVVQGLLDQREWIQQAQQRLSAAETIAQGLKTELDERLDLLGPGWTTKRLAATDTSPGAHFRLAGMARSFRNAHGRRARLKRSCDRQATLIAQRTEALTLTVWEHGGDDVSEALTSARRELDELQGLVQLQLREAELNQRHAGMEDQRARLVTRLTLPPWVYVMLGLFGVAGVALVMLGLSTGLQTSGLVGGIYMLLGATSCGIAWALKAHLESEVQQQLDELEFDADLLGREREEVRGRILRTLSPELQRLLKSKDGDEELSATDLIQRTAQRVAMLESLNQSDQQLKEARRRLDMRRARLQICDREVGTARQSWQELLTQLGFSPQLRMDEAFAHWRALVEAAELHRQREAVLKELSQLRWIVNAFSDRIAAVARRINGEEVAVGVASQRLDSWAAELKRYETRRKERRQMLRDARAALREAHEYQAQLHDLRSQKAALLAQGGAADHEDFSRRADAITRRGTLEDQLQTARRELEQAARTAPELAIAEEDLRRFDAQQNTRQIALLQRELQDLAGDLEKVEAKRAALQKTAEKLELGTATTEIRWKRELGAAALTQAASRWFALELVAKALASQRAAFERNCPPETLADASRSLARLTCGKYVNIWTPLGQRQLQVDDDQGRSWPVTALSRGSREQLFLAIRLALVQGFARRGVILPMVLDDVLVNFDERRTTAAAELFRDIAAEQQQQIVLLMSHQHVADIFAAAGASVIRLAEHRTPERKAG